MELKSNVINQEKTSQLISDTLTTLTETLSKSLGPYGSTTIIQDKLSMNHTITKDGYTILNKIKFDNEVSTTILEFVKKVSRSLVKEVGDGSTSAIMISHSLFQELNNLINHHNVPRKDIIDILSAYEKELTKYVNELSTPITEENFDKVKSIASVSNNNDDRAGDLIFHIYEKIGVNGFISLETSTNIEDSYIISEGIELPRGHISNIFANKPDKVTAEFEKPLVFICNEALDENDMELLADVMGKACLNLKRPLVVIAKGFDYEIKNFFHINKMENRQLDVTIVDYAIVNDNHRDTLEDLAIYLGATWYDKYGQEKLTEFPFERFGSCEKSIINETSSKFIKGIGEKAKIDERVELIESRIKEVEKKDKYIDTTEETFELKKRIANLNCLIATLYVGGTTDLEKETRKFLMEDAVFACQSALKYGYVSGGNLIIPRVLKRMQGTISTEMVMNKDLVRTIEGASRVEFFNEFHKSLMEAFTFSFLTVMANKVGKLEDPYTFINEMLDNDTIYNLKTDKFEDIGTTSIINSVKTDVEIMKATFSIIGLLVTSNQFISVQYQG
jgi:chaperonin GroEL